MSSRADARIKTRHGQMPAPMIMIKKPVERILYCFSFSFSFCYHLLFLILVLLPIPAKNNKTYQTIVRWSFIIPTSIALQQNLADVAYYSYSKKRTGIEIFSLIGHSKNVLLDYALDYWIVPLLMIPLCWLLYVLYKKINWPVLEWNRKTILQQSAIFL